MLRWQMVFNSKPESISKSVHLCIFHIDIQFGWAYIRCMSSTHHTSALTTVHEKDSPDLVTRVRAAFVLQGTTLNAWCLRNGLNRQYVDLSLRFVRNGPKAKALKAKTLKAAGVEQ